MQDGSGGGRDASDALSRRPANITGIIAMIASCASFACGDTLMKLASADLPTSELLCIRGLFGFSVAVLFAAWLGAFAYLPIALSPAMGMRAVSDVGGGWFFQSALARMPYAELTAVTQLNPLAITAASAIFLSERVGWRRWTASFAGLIGVLIIIRPGSSAFNWWALAGIASVLCSTVRDLSTRRVDRRVPPILMMMFSAAAVVLASLTVAPFGGWGTPSGALVLMLAGAAMFSLFGQLCVIVAVRAGDFSAVAPFRYTIIVFSIISGIFIFSHLPDQPTLFGIAIVTGAGLYTFFREQKLRRLAAQGLRR